MPRKNIEQENKLEYLSILDEHGDVDASLDPNLSGDVMLAMYRLMLFTRRLDERSINLQRQGRIGTYAPVRGQEAVQIGTVHGLRKSDWVVQSFREPGCCLARGWPISKILQFWGGYEESSEVPEGINDTPVCVPVASQIPHLTGIAWAMKIKGTDDVAIGFVGDGGTSEGDFHEGLTFAGVYQVPAVFVVVNNQWAISQPRRRQSAAKTLAQKALGYGFDGIQVDGNDVLAVHVATTEAIERARSGGGPTLIEAVTYRLSMHTTADDPSKYRDEADVEKWLKRDPLDRFAKYLQAKGVLDSKMMETLEKDIKEQIKAGVDEYESNREVDPLDCFDFLYNDAPAELLAQREEFALALRRESNGSVH